MLPDSDNRASSVASPAAIEIRDDVPATESDRYVEAHPRGTGYHLRAWTDIIGRAFGHRTTYLTARTAAGTAGVLPLVFFRSRLFGSFAVSLPFVNYGGVLADSDEIANALLERALEETRAAGGSHLELRHTFQTYPLLTPRRHKVAMVLGLADSSEQEWARLDRKVRNQVRKGEKSELSVEVGGGHLLDAFYEVFAHNMRDLGTPVYSRSFFREVLSGLPQSSRAFVVRHQGQPVAASIVCWHGHAMEVPWASALRSANPLCANVYLYWHMLKFAVEQRFKTFDFGRSTPNEGTFHFKKQWGAEPRELVWEYWTRPGEALPNLNPKNPKFDMAIRMWQRLPVPVASALGPHIVRNIP
jgi:FemAB-related protein (PEP-CTERM system-associated)